MKCSLFVRSIVAVRDGNFLGIFAGKIRFSEDWSTTHGVRSPISNLWLDYSQVNGTLNQTLVAEPRGPANVCLRWEVLDDEIGKEVCTPWRVSVRATQPTMPVDHLFRVAVKRSIYCIHPPRMQGGAFSKVATLTEKSLNYPYYCV